VSAGRLLLDLLTVGDTADDVLLDAVRRADKRLGTTEPGTA
jgi:hypothetical protein